MPCTHWNRNHWSAEGDLKALHNRFAVAVSTARTSSKYA